MRKRKKIPNNYEIRDGYAVIYLNRRNNSPLECKLDIEDLLRVLDFDYRWYSAYDADINNYYVRSTIYLGSENGKSKNTSIDIQSFLMNFPNGVFIDHINYDTLDNRKENLRIVEGSKNSKNRKSRNSNNVTGYRNVSLYNGRYLIQLQINGKNKLFAILDDVDQAGVLAEKLRKEHYGDFAGKN